MNISVILCSHNPRKDYLARTLDALRAQSLPQDQWELLLIDNCSIEPLTTYLDVFWHPRFRIVTEKELGLTPARIRGIEEATGEFLVFVDDDNLLDPDYLSNVIRIGREQPHIGVWGGEIQGEFEECPPKELKSYVEYMAVRALKRDAWSNQYGWSAALPIGAGMCMRREIARYYNKLCAEHPLRRKLDRQGTSLSCGGDLDLAYCAIDMGFGMGRFKCLRLQHLIPRKRMQQTYVLDLISGARSAAVIVDSLRDETQRMRPPHRPLWCNIQFLLKWLRASPFERSVMITSYRAEKYAWYLLDQTK